jgi:hypothetical protein
MYLPPIPLLSTIVYSRDILPKPNDRVAGEETVGLERLEPMNFGRHRLFALDSEGSA